MPETGDEAVPADAGRAFSWRTAALTFAVLRPELFRIVVQAAEVPLPGGEESGCQVPGHARQRTGNLDLIWLRN
jgi:hypothetical protein